MQKLICDSIAIMTSLKFFLLNISVLLGVLGEYNCANQAFTNLRF
jgi:hypothetical protein